MKQRIIICSLICLFFSCSLFSQSTSRGTLQIEFTGIGNSNGMIVIGINTSPDGWPRKPQIERQWKKDNVVDGVFTVVVSDLPYGTIAISALDDENSNQEMDMFLGIPKEGFGFSMNPGVRLSAPKFKACSFPLNSALTKIEIRMKYTGKGK
ncbi:MAG: DUF2141 domain-containing protein [Bacteroidales bacterium]|nr:DUF2141 domain-containing protein [Bacteroidales bacterium]